MLRGGDIAMKSYDELLLGARIECAELALAIGIECERRAKAFLDEQIGGIPVWQHPPSVEKCSKKLRFNA